MVGFIVRDFTLFVSKAVCSKKFHSGKRRIVTESILLVYFSKFKTASSTLIALVLNTTTLLFYPIAVERQDRR